MPPVFETVFTERTFVIIHNGDDFIQYLDCEAGTSLGTGQPYVEQFTDEAEARARAEELGYVFEDPDAEDPLAPPAPPEP